MKQDIENIIRTNLPEKKLPPHSDDEFIQIAKENGITITSENLSDIVKNMMLSMDNARFWEYRQGFNDCLLTIPITLIADEVLKVFEEEKYGLLKKYSQWLEKHSYMDCDWWAEIPCSVDRFLEELYLSTNKENKNNGNKYYNNYFER